MIIIIIIFYLIFFLFFYKTCKIKYLSYNEFLNITNSSEYFYKMNNYDLQVRKSNNNKEYLNKYQLGYQNFTIAQKNLLLYFINIIEKKIIKFKYFKNIPWIFVKIDDSLENSYPHTIENVIVLSNDFFNKSLKYQITTIIHEKVHIYQRIYPKYIEILYNNWGFNKIDFNIHNCRNNPDIKNYYSYNTNYLIIQLYYDNPQQLNHSNTFIIDLNNNNKLLLNNDLIKQFDLPDLETNNLEHPNELMADIISLYLTNSYNINDRWIKILNKWMLNYF
jgi:hypothetical protein